MLTSLYIKNIAVIKELMLDFNKGFTVFTGETGAGKSILIDALFVILGLRVSKEIIRKNEKSMYAEASFYFESTQEDSILNDYLEDNSLIISREIFQDGRNTVKINGRNGNTAILRELAPYLISIHSQNDNQRIFNSEMHYNYLDIYGDTTKLYEEYKSLYNEYTNAKNELTEAQNSKTMDLGQIEYLKFMKKDIEDANITLNEEEELKAIKQGMKEARLVSESVQSATGALFESETSAYNLIGEAIESIRKYEKFSKFTDKLMDLKEEIESISDEISDIYDRENENLWEKYKDIDTIEERLNEIYVIKSKYGGTVDSTLERLENANRELYNLENRESRIEELNEKVRKSEKVLREKAEKLSEERHKNALKLSKDVENQLFELMIPNAVFEVSFFELSEFTKYGNEKIEFLFSANIGMLPQPLTKIASGGEISRVNLAIKSILNNIDPASAFVFDEIDVGISGRAAQKVAEKMYSLSKGNQVLCVTHLPQIASMADNHFLITKNEDMNETKTTVKNIRDDERVKEIARIIGGVSVTELTLKNADETLKLAQKYKER